MPTQRGVARATKDRRAGGSAGAQASELVRHDGGRLAGDVERVCSPAPAIGIPQARRTSIKTLVKRSVRGGKRAHAASTIKTNSTTTATRAKRKASAKKTTRTRVAGATRAARTRAMRARIR